jgi:hypothetical protein
MSGHIHDACFLDGGNCASCCGDCEDLIALESGDDHREANGIPKTRCVCFSGEASGLSRLHLSNYDDCLHITGDDNEYIFGGDGDDVIVITGDSNDYVWGGDGDDVITINGNRARGIYGNDGDDTITIIGDDSQVNGEHGDDTIIIYGNNPWWYGDSGHDSCSINGEVADDEVHSCEREADVPLVSHMKALYDIKVEDVDEANEISGRITSADPAAVSVEGLENVTCLSIAAPATYTTFA